MSLDGRIEFRGSKEQGRLQGRLLPGTGSSSAPFGTSTPPLARPLRRDHADRGQPEPTKDGPKASAQGKCAYPMKSSVLAGATLG